ncbi:hypothetical protein AWB76_05705 [Caballeronia temeraria]|uniref:Uncharacterized protein n=1 Tax=Caballeronia temeraria TaxID=1777137 RepID=A0A158CMM8_9BURK|nr:hypothetical protein [Caballeronia temeraria]SAK83106.1 hypothetical protein AWB76_05705 [Caballeronia temeraria]
MEQRGDGSSLYFVICPRCETLSAVEESVCPFCGADRHGAVLTRGAGTALRAVEAARGVTRHFQTREEPPRLRWFSRPSIYEPRLPAAVSSNTAVLETERSSHSILATVAMGTVVLIACFLARAYVEQRGSTPRAASLPVAVAGAVAGTVGTAAAKAPATVVNLDSADRIAEGSSHSVQRPSPVIPVAASSTDSTRQNVVAERSVEKKEPTPSTKRTLKTASKRISKDVSKTASKNVSKPTSKSATACSHKSDRKCVEATKGHPSKKAPNQQQTRTEPASRTKSGTKDFQKIAAIAPPVKPAMTADGSWRPSKKN